MPAALSIGVFLPSLLTALFGGLALVVLTLAADPPRRRRWLACPLLILAAAAALAGAPGPGLVAAGFGAVALATALAAWTEQALPGRRRLAWLAAAALASVLPALSGLAPLHGAQAAGALLLLGAGAGYLTGSEGVARPTHRVIGLLLVLAAALALAGFLGATAEPAALVPAALALAAAVPALVALADLLARNEQLRREAVDSADRLRDLAEISSDWLWESDAEHRLTYVSPRCTEVTGLPTDGLIGRTRIEAAGGSPESPFWRSHWADLQAHRPISDFVYDVRVPGAGVRSLRVSGRPIFDDAGRFVGYRGIGDDVTEIRRAEAAVQRLQGRLESALVSLDRGFALYDENERLVAFNDAYYRFVPSLVAILEPGRTLEEILGFIWDSGAYEGQEPDREGFVRRRLSLHRNAPYEIEQTLADGTVLQVSGRPTQEGGRVLLLSDVTERRRRERVLETLVRRREGETTLAAIAEAGAIAAGFPGAGVARCLEDGRVELAAWYGRVAPASGLRLHFDEAGRRGDEPVDQFVGRDAGQRFAGSALIGTSGAVAYLCRRLELLDGAVIGYLVALDDRPHDSNPADPELLNLVARSASLELRRLQADEALKLSEERFRDIAEVNSDWIWETDAEHRYTYLSPRFETVTGVPIERVLGLTRLQLAAADPDDPVWQGHLADVAAHRDIREFVYSAQLLSEGKPSRYRITAKARFDEQGSFLGYRGTASDIAELVETRAAVEELRGRLEAAVAVLPDGFALFDRDDRLIVCNDVYRSISPSVAKVAVPGASFESIVRAALADGLLDPGGTDTERFVAERVARHRRLPYRIEATYTDGRVVQLSGVRMPDGGSVLLRTDIGVHVRRARVLSILVESRTRGRDLLEAASEALTTGLGFRWAGVARRAKEAGQAELLAIWDGREAAAGEPFDYPLAGTPCDHVYDGDARCFWPRGVAKRFPHDPYLHDLGVEAYRGQLLLDGAGRVLGHIFAMHDEPAAAGAGDDDIVQLVANAVAIELQRLEAAQERDRAAELLRIIFENVRVGITVVDRNLRVIGHNDRFRELLEFPPELMETGSFEAIVRFNAERGEYGPGDIETLVEQRLALARRFEAHRFERRRPDGRFIEVRGDPLPGGGFVATYTDVTERRRMEDALRRSELRYRLTSEMTSDLLYSFRIAPDGTPVAEWFAGSLGDVSIDLGDHGEPGSAWRSWKELFHPDDRPAIDARNRRLLAGENTIDELRMVLDGGRLVWVRLHGRPEVDEEGRVVRVLGAAQDVTERRQSEAELRSAMETAELANRAKSEFLATMSHELRTPLNAIIGFSEIMTQELLGPLGDDRYRSYSQDIRDSGTHLLEIINDILDVSKAEAGMLELAEEEMAVASAVAASLRLIRPRAERGGVRLISSLPADLPRLCADPRRLKQILLNLLSNAVKFTPTGGTVSVDAWVEPDNGLAVQVCDTGIGIKPEDLERVLEPFTQVDSGFSRRHEGTGLGLPLTKALVELHGGSLELGGNGPAGTRALVRFPAERVGPARQRRLASTGTS